MLPCTKLAVISDALSVDLIKLTEGRPKRWKYEYTDKALRWLKIGFWCLEPTLTHVLYVFINVIRLLRVAPACGVPRSALCCSQDFQSHRAQRECLKLPRILFPWL